MKKILTILLFFFGLNLFSQELPSEPSNGAAFPIGSKFTIKLIPTSKSEFDYSIIKFEQFTETIDTWENDHLFSNEGEKNTIDFYFCLATSGESEEEKEKNMKVVLIFKNHTEYSMSYDSEIQLKEDGDFEKTSNVGTFRGAKGTEMWPYMIQYIGLSNFKLLQ